MAPEGTRAVTCLLVCLTISQCCGFNVDLLSRIVHTSPQPGSWFGYSVAMYKHGTINTMLVGAPKYNTSQPGILEGGAVLRCSVEDARERCEYVPFDNRSNMRLNHMDYYIDNKSNQFFGATLKSRDGIVLACAPRYVWFTSSRRRREPVGTCYVARQDLTDFQEFSPCRTEKWGYHRQGSCQAGFDAALSKDGERMYIGAPGAYYWQGQIHSQSLVTNNEYFTTGEGPADEDDQYLGYSVTAGEFDGDGIQDVALGVPKGLNYTGKVSLYSHDLRWLQNITGDQLGSYFGYCLAVVDFNGDSLDDIIVGAPMFTDFADREMKIEVGKIHVLLQDNRHRLSNAVSYVGEVSRGRFGLSVASLGDINLDGFTDFAVGAPYGGRDGRGAVFIYHGFNIEEGVNLDAMKIPAQVIFGSEVGRGFSTFGWSLAGGLDVDDNQYPDVVVGAYESERAFVFKSRPIIKFLEHKLDFKSQGKAIDINTKNCEIRRNVFHTCVDLVFCLAYTGINVDDKMELDVEFRLDTLQDTEQRILFESNAQSVHKETIPYDKENIRCRTLKTFLKNSIVDKLTPLAAGVNYTLIDRRRSSRSLTPVLDQDQRLSMQDSLTIHKNCGPDNVCIPDLVLTFDAPDQFIVGESELVNVSVLVENKGEDAFQAFVFITEPKGLSFMKSEPRENTSCSTRRINNLNYVKCGIGNPLQMHHSVRFQVSFQHSGLVQEPSFEFIATANSTNEEDGTSDDNVVSKTVFAKVEAELTLFGSSDPDSVIYNTSLYQIPLRNHESHYGPTVVHKYGLVSKGPSDINGAQVIILWPSRTLSGKHLLYLMEQPITIGNIRCDPVPEINPLGLQTISEEERIRTLGITSWEDAHQAAESSSSGGRRGESSSLSKTGSSSTSSSSSSSFISTSSRGGSAVNNQNSYDTASPSRESDSSPSSGSSSRFYSGGSSNQGSRSYGGREFSDSKTEGSIHRSTERGERQYSKSGSVSATSSNRDLNLPSSRKSGGRFSGTLFTVQQGSDHRDNAGRTSPDWQGSVRSEGEANYGRTYSSSSEFTGSKFGHSGEREGSVGGQPSLYDEDLQVTSNRGGYRRWQNSTRESGRGRGLQEVYHYPEREIHHRQYISRNEGQNSRIHPAVYYEKPSLSSSSSSSSVVSEASHTYRSSSSWEGDHENAYKQNEVEHRTKRDTEEWNALVGDCGATLCTRIKCHAGRMSSNDSLYIYIRSRLWIDTLTEDPKFKFPVDDVTVSTRMVVRTSVIPPGSDSESKTVYSKNIVTPIRSAKSLAAAPPVPWWVILLATLAGILILLLIILILWKLGFFKRQRAKSSSS